MMDLSVRLRADESFAVLSDIHWLDTGAQEDIQSERCGDPSYKKYIFKIFEEKLPHVTCFQS